MAKGNKNKSREATIENRRARHDYTILDTIECGVQLVGSEVKAVREGNASLAEGYVSVKGDPPELTLWNVNIGEYAPAGAMQHKLTRTRRLLAKRREIDKLARQVDQKGLTLVPLRMYFKNGFVKVLVGLAEGRRNYDKRQAIKERETKRELQRAMSKQM